MQGGDPSILAGEAIVLRVVYDGSGSMAANIDKCNRMILKTAESLPELVKSLEIGITVHRKDGINTFPIAQIKDKSLDGGTSYENLAKFVTNIQASGNDASMQEMLASGMKEVAKAGQGKRQFLMIVGDHADFQLADPSRFQAFARAQVNSVSSWCNQHRS